MLVTRQAAAPACLPGTTCCCCLGSFPRQFLVKVWLEPIGRHLPTNRGGGQEGTGGQQEVLQPTSTQSSQQALNPNESSSVINTSNGKEGDSDTNHQLAGFSRIIENPKRENSLELKSSCSETTRKTVDILLLCHDNNITY